MINYIFQFIWIIPSILFLACFSLLFVDITCRLKHIDSLLSAKKSYYLRKQTAVALLKPSAYIFRKCLFIRQCKHFRGFIRSQSRHLDELFILKFIRLLGRNVRLTITGGYNMKILNLSIIV